jgi:hypothetical protein
MDTFVIAGGVVSGGGGAGRRVVVTMTGNGGAVTTGTALHSPIRLPTIAETQQCPLPAGRSTHNQVLSALRPSMLAIWP